jgi:serine/threonine-protein kinase
MPDPLDDLVNIVSQRTERRLAYAAWLVAKYQTVHLGGLDPTRPDPLGLPLMDLHVALRGRRRLPGGEAAAAEPLSELVQAHPELLVLGEPGAGKTTFLKHLALAWAGETLAAYAYTALQSVPAWSGQTHPSLKERLPLMVPLGAYARVAKEQALEPFVVAYVATACGPAFPMGPLVEAALTSGRALLLLDGLDEAGDLATRKAVVARVVDLFAAMTRSGNRCVVTSRIEGYREIRQRVHGMAECTVVDFDDDEIAAFASAFDRVTGDPPPAPDRGQATLLSTIASNPRVRRLAGTPLLLTVLALFNRAGRAVPERGVELYELLVEGLINHWVTLHAVDAVSEQLDTPDTLRRVLEAVALAIQETDPTRGLVPEGQLKRVVAETLTAIGVARPDAPRRLLQQMRSDVGLLAERGPRAFGFVHPTLGEYLAAAGVVTRSGGDTHAIAAALGPRLTEPHWREVILLAVSYLGVINHDSVAASALIEALLTWETDPPGHGAALLGEAVAENAPGDGSLVGVTATCRQLVAEALQRALADRALQPAERTACGDALAKVGPPDVTSAAASRPASSQSPSVAILAFEDLSPEKNLEYFCDGVAEEILHGLARVTGLRVAARSSAFQFRGKSEDIREIGRVLKVATVLEGSVRAARQRLRISARLVNAADGYQLWAERFDRDLGDIFAVQDEIADAVVRNLRLQVDAVRSDRVTASGTRNLEAYTLYLKGRHHWNKRTEADLRKSVDCFEDAIDRDAGYAQAYAGLAESYVTLGLYGALSPAETMPRARASALRATEIAGPSPSAATTLACVDAAHDWSWAEAERQFKQAIALGPGEPTARHRYAINYLVPLGRFDEADAELRRAREMDPLSSAISVSVGMRSYFAHRYAKAVEELSATIDLDATFAPARLFMGLTLTELGRFDDALQELDTARRLSGGSPETIAAAGYASARAGHGQQAQRALEELTAQSSSRYVSPSLVAQIHAGLDDTASALVWLEKAFEARAADLIWLAGRPVFDGLRADPGFIALQQRLNLSPA